MKGFRWFLAMSIRWKLQFGFFVVTMVTTFVNRWAGYEDLHRLIETVQGRTRDAELARVLRTQLDEFVFDSIWQSALELALVFLVIGVLANLFVRPVKSLCAAVSHIEKGDLTRGVPNHSLDEIGILERSFNNMVSNLNEVIRNIDESGKEMASSAFQVAAIAHEIAEGSKAEHHRSADVASANHRLQETSASVRQVAKDATDRAVVSDERAKEGMGMIRQNIATMDETVGQVTQASEQMQALNEAAQQINLIVETIRTIAEQTNMLALNAAIEAARAGEQGRGFAVVADEVRDLAARTTSSTGEIADIIARLNQHVGQVTQSMSRVVERVNHSQEGARATARVIEDITEQISQTAAATRKIFDVSNDQMGQFESLQAHLSSLFATFKESSTKVETTATIGDDLYRITEKLNALLRRFKFNRETRIPARPDEQRAVPRVGSSLRVRVRHKGAELEGVTKDVSMTGVRLRTNERLHKGEKVTLLIYIPYDDLETYQRQKPLEIGGEIMWDHEEGGRSVCGIHFEALNASQREGIKRCFDYFSKEAHFSSAA